MIFNLSICLYKLYIYIYTYTSWCKCTYPSGIPRNFPQDYGSRNEDSIGFIFSEIPWKITSSWWKCCRKSGTTILMKQSWSCGFCNNKWMISMDLLKVVGKCKKDYPKWWFNSDSPWQTVKSPWTNPRMGYKFFNYTMGPAKTLVHGWDREGFKRVPFIKSIQNIYSLWTRVYACPNTSYNL